MFDSRTVTQIKLRYRDASTPPRHHRSYTLVVTREVIEVSIDVYGVVIAQEHNLVLEGEWLALAQSAGELECPVETDADGSTGGSSYTVELTAGAAHRTCTWLRERTPGSERLTAFAKRFERMVPNLAALIETPYSG